MVTPQQRQHLTLEELLDRHTRAIEYITFAIQLPTSPEAAAALQCNIQQIAKTCILKTDKKQFIAVILLGTDRIDTSALKNIVGCKKLNFASADEVLTVTGYVAGGVPPIGLGCAVVKIYMDEKVFEYCTVYAGGGKQESIIKITPQLIQEISAAEVVAVSKERLA